MRLLVINDYGVEGGGTEQRVRLLLEGFLKKKCFDEIHVLQHKSSHSKIPMVHFHSCGSGFLECLNKTRKIIKENKIDLVQAHNLLLIHPVAFFAAKIEKKPVVWFAHDFWPICGKRSFVDADNAIGKELCKQANFSKCVNCVGLRGRARLLINEKMVNLSTKAISPTNAMKKIFEEHGVCKGKWEVIRPWADLEKLAKINCKEKKERIVFAGPLSDYKGALVLARAFNIVARKEKKFSLFFVGSQCNRGNKNRKKIEKELSKKAAERTQFINESKWKKVQQIICCSKILAFPSVCMESHGNLWVEAMALGTVPVISKLDTLKESLEWAYPKDSKAILFEPKNHEMLAKKILSLVKAPDKWKKISLLSKEMVFKKFKVEIACEKLCRLYKKTITA